MGLDARKPVFGPGGFALRLMKSIIYEALPGVLGNRGTRPFISREQGNKCHFSGEQAVKFEEHKIMCANDIIAKYHFSNWSLQLSRLV